MKTYSEKLKDPRWQKKRLEVLQRDEFKCCLCEDKDTELHVHHLQYKGEPWEVNLELLQTLCKNCHSFITETNRHFKKNPINFLSAVCIEHGFGKVFMCDKGHAYITLYNDENKLRVDEVIYRNFVEYIVSLRFKVMQK